MARPVSRYPLLGVAAALALAGCAPPKEKAAPPVQRPAPLTTAALPSAVLNRAELLSALASASEAAALGAAAPKTVAALAGRRFSVKLPFACFGPTGPAADLGFGYDAAKKAMTLTARPKDWSQDPAVRPLLATEETEGIEGFVIPRPWITTDACPAPGQTGAADQPPAALAPRYALAEIFSRSGSRVMRRNGKPYEVSRKVDAPPMGAFRLVLEGRIVVDGAGLPVTCRSDTPDAPPRCFVRVEFDRVAIEAADSSVVGEWSAA